jgi:hypothetical protein
MLDDGRQGLGILLDPNPAELVDDTPIFYRGLEQSPDLLTDSVPIYDYYPMPAA